MLSSFIFMSEIQIMIPSMHLKHKMHCSKGGHSYNQQVYTWKFHLIVEPIHTHTHISLGLGFEDSF